jgi:hypothetical protein
MRRMPIVKKINPLLLCLFVLIPLRVNAQGLTGPDIGAEIVKEETDNSQRL